MDLKDAYRALDPAHPVDPNSAYYVARADNPVSRIIAELQLTSEVRRYLLTGHRGTGKTTELNRIEAELTGKKFVQRYYVTSKTTNIVEEIAVMMENSAMSLPVTGGKRENPFLSRFADAVSNLRSLTGLPVVILIDGIDKLDVDEAFYHLRILLQERPSPAHIVSTVPLTVPLNEDFGGLNQSIDAWHFLPCIDLWTRGGEKVPAGWALCQEILERRAPRVFTQPALDILVENSAGIHRELLRLAQKAVVFSATRSKAEVDHHDAMQAIHEVRNEYSIMLRSEDIELLCEIDRNGRISGDPRLTRLVRDQFIVAYGGGGAWFAVHPIIRPLIADRQLAFTSS